MKFKLKNVCVKILGSMLIAGGVFAASSGLSHNAVYAGKFLDAFKRVSEGIEVYDKSYVEGEDHSNILSYLGRDIDRFKKDIKGIGKRPLLIGEASDAEEPFSVEKVLDEEKDFSLYQLSEEFLRLQVFFDNFLERFEGKTDPADKEISETLSKFKKDYITSVLDFIGKVRLVNDGKLFGEMSELTNKFRNARINLVKMKCDDVKGLYVDVKSILEKMDDNFFEKVKEAGVAKFCFDRLDKLSRSMFDVYMSYGLASEKIDNADKLALQQYTNAVLNSLNYKKGKLNEIMGAVSTISAKESFKNIEAGRETSFLTDFVDWLKSLADKKEKCKYEDFRTRRGLVTKLIVGKKFIDEVNVEEFDVYIRLLGRLRDAVSDVLNSGLNQIVTNDEAEKKEVEESLRAMITVIDTQVNAMKDKKNVESFKSGGVESLINSFGNIQNSDSEEVRQLSNKVFGLVDSLKDEDLAKDNHSRLVFLENLVSAMQSGFEKIKSSGKYQESLLNHYGVSLNLLKDKIKKVKDLRNGVSSNDSNFDGSNNINMGVNNAMNNVGPYPGQMIMPGQMFNQGTMYGNNMMGMNNTGFVGNVNNVGGFNNMNMGVNNGMNNVGPYPGQMFNNTMNQGTMYGNNMNNMMMSQGTMYGNNMMNQGTMYGNNMNNMMNQGTMYGNNMNNMMNQGTGMYGNNMYGNNMYGNNMYGNNMMNNNGY